jgi:predicted metal-binding membrane protein
LLVSTTLIFAISAVTTVVWCTAMPATAGMPMPGGWTMSMTWMRMPGQTWLDAALSFAGMWIVMTIAMMTPSLTLMLRRFREAVAAPGAGGDARLGRMTALVAAGYFLVWILPGLAAFPAGAAIAAIAMRRPDVARAVPVAAGLVVSLAGALQFSAWKARHLACCRSAAVRRGLPLPRADYAGAWRHGVALGLHCVCCGAGATAVLQVLGVMDLRAMAIVTAAVTIERFASDGTRAARVLGAVGIAAGLAAVAGAAGVGT